jgi:hypothetical protein
VTSTLLEYDVESVEYRDEVTDEAHISHDITTLHASRHEVGIRKQIIIGTNLSIFASKL